MNAHLLLALSLMSLPTIPIAESRQPQSPVPIAVPLDLHLPAATMPVPQVRPPQRQPIPQPATPAIEPLPVFEAVPLPGGDMDPNALPDLIVSDLFLAGDEARFKVQNRGLGEKKPAQINYALTLQYPNQGSVTYSGIAAITSLYRLRTLEETAEDRASQYSLQNITDGVVLTLCINPDQQVAEDSYDNNCLTRTAGELLPDLTITGGGFNLNHYRVPDQPWYDDVLDTIGDVLCPTSPGIDFDTSGLTSNTATVRIQNVGGVPVMNFWVTVESSTDQLGGKVWKRQVTDRLAPGEARDIEVYVDDLPQRGVSFDVLATIDPENKVREIRENNNARTLPLVRDHRNQGTPNGPVTGSCD